MDRFAVNKFAPRWLDLCYAGQVCTAVAEFAPQLHVHPGLLHAPLPALTTCTHSMRGRRTAWFPERLTTQAGVSGVPSSKAMTASTPILLPCRDRDGDGDVTTALLSWDGHRRDGAAYQDAVEGGGRPTALHVAQDGDAGVVAQTLHHQLQDSRVGVGMGCPNSAGTNNGSRNGGLLIPLTSLTSSEVMALPCLSMAPSATMMMFSLEPPKRVWGRRG